MAKLFGIEQNNLQPRQPALGIHVRRLYTILAGEYDPAISGDPVTGSGDAETGKVKVFRSGEPPVSLNDDFLYRDPVDREVYPQKDLSFLNGTLFLDSADEVIGFNTLDPTVDFSTYDSTALPKYTLDSQYLRLYNRNATKASGVVFHGSTDETIWNVQSGVGLEWRYNAGSGNSSPTNSTVLMELHTSGGDLEVEGDVVAKKSSDARLKDEVKVIKDAVSKLDLVQGVEFKWNEGIGESRVGNIEYGVLAHQVEEALPHAVTERSNGYKAVDYDALAPFLLQVCKEQQQQIKDLKARVKSLEQNG